MIAPGRKRRCLNNTLPKDLLMCLRWAGKPRGEAAADSGSSLLGWQILLLLVALPLERSTGAVVAVAMSKGGLVASAQSGADRYRRRLLAAAGLSNNLLLSNLNTTVTIKSSPPKTAEETARLGIIAGFLTKRNEQHSWQRRFCALVPQSFLYYFEDDGSESPRGIIDLEWYTDISAQPNNVVKLATTDGSHRTFYFQADSEEEMNAWMSALVRERFFALRDERDAYQELQHDFQAQSAADGEEVRRVAAERVSMTEVEERALREEADVAHQLGELVASVEGVLPTARSIQPTEGGGGEDDGAAISERAVEALAAGGRALVDRVADLEARLLESKNGAARMEEELKDYRDQILAVSSELDLEAKALAREQKLKAAEMEDVASLNAEVEEAHINLGIIERTKESAEHRVVELNDQKKLLVREVKAARKLLAEKKSLQGVRDDEDRWSPPPSDDAVPVAARADPVPGSLEAGFLPDQAPSSAAAPTSSARFFDKAAKLFDYHKAPTPPHQKKKTSLLSARDEPTEESRPAPDPARPGPVVVRCRRCHGTLEGPLNSTCTCLEPLLDDASSVGAPSVTSYLKSWGGLTTFFSPTKDEATTPERPSTTPPVRTSSSTTSDPGTGDSDDGPRKPADQKLVSL